MSAGPAGANALDGDRAPAVMAAAIAGCCAQFELDQVYSRISVPE
jgi:hypothetical protein